MLNTVGKHSFHVLCLENGQTVFSDTGTKSYIGFDTIIALNSDIYADDTQSSVYMYASSAQYSMVFLKAPPQLQLPKVVRAETLTGVMMEILTILSVGMTCLISCVGLRKAYSLLREILLKA